MTGLLPGGLVRSCGHGRQGREEQGRRSRAAHQEGQPHADEGRQGVIRAGSRGPQVALGTDIEQDAQPISHKAKQQRRDNLPYPGNPASRGQGNAQRPQPGA